MTTLTFWCQRHTFYYWWRKKNYHTLGIHKMLYEVCVLANYFCYFLFFFMIHIVVKQKEFLYTVCLQALEFNILCSLDTDVHTCQSKYAWNIFYIKRYKSLHILRWLNCCMYWCCMHPSISQAFLLRLLDGFLFSSGNYSWCFGLFRIWRKNPMYLKTTKCNWGKLASICWYFRCFVGFLFQLLLQGSSCK